MRKYSLSTIVMLATCTALYLGAPVHAQPNRAGKRTIYVHVHADSAAPGYNPVNALDGDPNTIWHTPFRKQTPGVSHEIVVDLGAPHVIDGFEYLPRAGGGNGTIKRFAFYVSDDDCDFGAPAARSSFARGLQSVLA